MGAHRAIIATLLLAFGGACRPTHVAVQNLDAVLSSSDQFRYQGPTTTVWRDFFDEGIGALFSGLLSSDTDAPEMEPIADPTGLALDNLLRLAGSTQGGEAWRLNEQVRVLARFAVGAPSQLARERALIELGPHAQRLGLEALPIIDDGLDANAPELIEALDGLIDASRRVMAEGDAPSATGRADFDAAVAVLQRPNVDVEGGTRLLRAIAPFLRARRLPSAFRARLEELSLGVQRTVVGEALVRGLGDRSPLARSGAFRAALQVFGEDFAIEALLAMVDRSSAAGAIGDRYSSFGLATIPAAFTEVHLVIADSFLERGLPVAATAATPDALRLRGTIFASLASMAGDDFLFTPRSRNAAMRALGSVSGGELWTLREEEWADWFLARSDELGAEIQRLEAVDRP